MESLAAALRLSDDERRYLFLLAKSDKIGEPEAYKEISIGLEDTIIDRNIFLTNSGSLIKKSGAQLTQRQTTKFEVV
ncbi:DUF2922 domain-containing protein [Clostridium sp. DL-VIII]|uniref:DUF2922 domain-containing protein n=1 Tax=Clostridium sp. DL-VIII TaxID=641107 RepID=UPI001FA8022B|nr:DUF2922 domain-containing protein [Clostridium sp. DL-VIII]